MKGQFYNKNETSYTSLLIKNARIFCPEQNIDIANGYVATKNGLIESIGKGSCQQESLYEKVIDTKGLFLTAGFIDIQVHFRDPGQTHKEDIISGSKAAVSGGVTCVVCQPNTAPTIDNLYVLDYLKYKAAAESYCDIKVYASVTKNLAGLEICDLETLCKHELVVGFTDDGLPVNNPQIMRLAFEASAKHGFIVAQHAEDHALSNKGAINEGDVSKKLEVRGIPNSSESSIVARDIEILRETGGHYHVLHLSCRESLELVKKAKMDGLNITCEASPHHLLLTDETVLQHGANAKMNPPIRSQADKLALIQGLKDGYIDAIATDHAPHDAASKNKHLHDATFGIIGLESMFAGSMQLHYQYGVELKTIISALTHKPAKVIGLKNVGSLKVGYKANFTLSNLNEEWTFDEQNIHSKCQNSPFFGTKFKGKVKTTIIDGKIVFSE